MSSGAEFISPAQHPIEGDLNFYHLGQNASYLPSAPPRSLQKGLIPNLNLFAMDNDE